MTNAIEIHVNLWTQYLHNWITCRTIEKFIKIEHTNFVQVVLTVVLHPYIRVSTVYIELL